jgi:P2 family phage contractile tail tube protein
MSLGHKVKSFVLHYNGNNYAGMCEDITLPKLARKMEDFRGGGMDVPVKVDVGGEAMSLEFTIGDAIPDLTSRFMESLVDGIPLRLMAYSEEDDTASVMAIEFAFRGRFSEIDMGELKPGDLTKTKYKFECAYFKIIKNGVTVIEKDIVKNIEIVAGVDIYAKRRAATGLNY